MCGIEDLQEILETLPINAMMDVQSLLWEMRNGSLDDRDGPDLCGGSGAVIKYGGALTS